MKLTYKFLLIVTLTTILLVGVLSYFSFTLTKSAIQNSIEDQQLQLARQVMDKIDRVLHERYIDVQSIAGDQDIKDYLLTFKNKSNIVTNISNVPQGLVRRVNELSVVTGPWDEIDVIGIDGVIRYSIDEDSVGENVLDVPAHTVAFQKALAGEAFHSDALFDEVEKKPTMFFAVPIRADSQPTKPIIGVVMVHLAWPIVYEVVESVRGSIVDLYNNKGIVIAANDNPEAIFKVDNHKHPSVKDALLGKEQSRVVIGIDNVETVSSTVTEKGFSSYKGNKWVLLIEQPTKIAFAPAVSSAITTTLISIPIVLLANIFLLFFILRFLKPVGTLTKITNQFAQGDLKQRVLIKSKDELGQLASAFNIMADKLQESLTGLEQKVKEKTAELQKEKEGVEQKVIERTKEVSQEKARLQASINSLSVGYIMTGPKNETIIINAAAENIFLLTTPSARPASKAIDVSWLRGKIDLYFLQTELKGKIDIFASILQVKNERKTLVFKNIPYKMLFLSFYVNPIIDPTTDEVIGSVLLIEDITEQKILDRSRDEFFSIASQELRTPLTAIRGNTSMLKDYYMEEIKSPEVKEIILDVHDSSLRLIDIVNDFLDMSRLEQGKIQYESTPFEVEKLCDEAIKEYNVTGSRMKLDLLITAPQEKIPLVYADKSRVRQAIVNLLSNAIKFTENGGVNISFESSGNSVKVLVSDTGKGISEKNRNLLFRKFQQAEDNILTRDNTRGTGLGLYISKLMMKGMGGDVQLEKSALNVGSTFSVTIPIATLAQAATFKKEESTAQSAGKPPSVSPENASVEGRTKVE